MSDAPGLRFRAALLQEYPLQIVRMINAYAALQAALENVVEDVHRITGVTQETPLTCGCRHRLGTALNIAHGSGIDPGGSGAGIHIEDRAQRCGHRAGKMIVSAGGEMVDRLKMVYERPAKPVLPP